MREHVETGRSETLSVTRPDPEANDNNPEARPSATAHAILGHAKHSLPSVRHLRVEADGRTAEFLVSDEELTQLMGLLYGVEGLSQPESQDQPIGFARSSMVATANPKVDLALATTIVLISAMLIAVAYFCI
ncbi:hypothetical protein [Rhizobium ruizarguesonis]|uniref:hypothetical protein n=1 Tax=Rhizobium ruizarguesonis TaxID=2081791 RepID=UPI0013BEBA75|nr:hypothetical protein [Rhizobium ruizarguesonis]NEJ02634.1 hypothetical protein [Rhizobium ruizarguesonis]NEJ39761.1 hypothetical protein [Rhizobium ruizarguesonis]